MQIAPQKIKRRYFPDNFVRLILRTWVYSFGKLVTVKKKKNFEEQSRS